MRRSSLALLLLLCALRPTAQADDAAERKRLMERVEALEKKLDLGSVGKDRPTKFLPDEGGREHLGNMTLVKDKR